MKKFIEKIRRSKTCFWTGVVLLIVNPPLGWAGFMMGGYLSAKYQNPKYLIISTIFYAITWGMVGAGIFLAGPKGVALAKSTTKKIWRKILGKRKRIDADN